jgi:hypothetical protein
MRSIVYKSIQQCPASGEGGYQVVWVIKYWITQMTGDPLLGDLGVPVLSSAACCVPTRGTDDSFL